MGKKADKVPDEPQDETQEDQPTEQQPLEPQVTSPQVYEPGQEQPKELPHGPVLGKGTPNKPDGHKVG